MTDQILATTGANSAQIAHWNSAQMRNWAHKHAVMDDFFQEITARLLAFAAPRPGEHAIDIGCGSGTTVLALGDAVGPAGQVLGVDVAATSVERASERITAAGLAQSSVVQADATEFPFSPRSFDLGFSRFGVMFFADPAASFGHIRKALKPGGRLALAVFRTAAENVWASGPPVAIADLVPPSAPAGPEAPGQFSWADPMRVRRILAQAGFGDIGLEPLDIGMRFARRGEPEQAMVLSRVVGPVSRALAAADPALRPQIEARVTDWFAEREGPEGIVLPAALWLVSARA